MNERPQSMVTCARGLLPLLVCLLCAWTWSVAKLSAEQHSTGRAPIELDQPLVITKPGHKRLNRDCRAKGTAIIIAAPNVTLDLNGHTIYYGSDNGTADWNFGKNGRHGVVLWTYYNTEINIPGAVNPINAVIKNGSIIDEGTGAVAHAIEAASNDGWRVQNIRAEVYGTDSAAVWATWGTGTVLDSVLISHTTDSFDRHAAPANVYAIHVALTAQGNVLIGGNSGFTAGEGSQIIGNVISQSGPVTNGYGVGPENNSVVRDNLILPSNGRGVILNGRQNVQILDNVILHLELPNVEFGDALNPPAIRARYDSYGNTVTGNVSLGIAGAGGRTSASGLYLTNSGAGPANLFENNTLTTILAGARDGDHYAQPLTMENQGYAAESQDVIRNNVFRSNDTMIRVQGYDGSTVAQVPLLENALQWVDGNTAQADFIAAAQQKLIAIGLAANPDAVAVLNNTISLIGSLIQGVPLSPEHAAWFVKSWGNDPVTATALDTQWGPGVAPDSYAYGSLNAGTVSVRVGQTVSAILVNSSSVPITNQTVQVTTDRGDVYNVTTDSSGRVTLPVIEFALDKAFAAGSPVLKIARTTSTISVTGYPTATLTNTFLLAHKGDTPPLTIMLGAGADTTAPTVTAFSPANAATNVPSTIRSSGTRPSTSRPRGANDSPGTARQRGLPSSSRY